MGNTIQRIYAPAGSTYSQLKPRNHERRQQMLLEGLTRYDTFESIVGQIRGHANDASDVDPLFISDSHFWGPNIPKSAQKLLAAGYIRQCGIDAFRDGKFDFDKFVVYLNFNGLSDISKELKKSYFENITMVAGQVRLAALRSEYFVCFPLSSANDANEPPLSEQVRADLDDNPEYVCMASLNNNVGLTSTEPCLNPVNREHTQKIIQAALEKHDGYPTIEFFAAIDLLSAKGLKPTLLLIDDFGAGSGAPDTKTIQNQKKLIIKVTQSGGNIFICTEVYRYSLKRDLQDTVDNCGAKTRVYQGNGRLNKLSNGTLLADLEYADYVIIAGYEANYVIRNTVGVSRDHNQDMLLGAGLMQHGIPTLYADFCSTAADENKWEGARSKPNLYFWRR